MDSADLVPGDIVLIAIGNIIPADLKLLGEEGDDVPMQARVDDHLGGKPREPREGTLCASGMLLFIGSSLVQIDQAALTGESLPAKKFAGDVCFSGSTVKQGEKHAVVYATGLNTFFGRAASLIAVRPPSCELSCLFHELRMSQHTEARVPVMLLAEIACCAGHTQRCQPAEDYDTYWWCLPDHNWGVVRH